VWTKGKIRLARQVFGKNWVDEIDILKNTKY
jgi:hypothetical protein